MANPTPTVQDQMIRQTGDAIPTWRGPITQFFPDHIVTSWPVPYGKAPDSASPLLTPITLNTVRDLDCYEMGKKIMDFIEGAK
jgi:hypothetical protein